MGAVLREQNALPYGICRTISLMAKDDVNNVGAGRAAKGANPFVRTNKSTNFDKKFVDFPYLYKLLMLTKKVGSGLLTKKKCML